MEENELVHRYLCKEHLCITDILELVFGYCPS